MKKESRSQHAIQIQWNKYNIFNMRTVLLKAFLVTECNIPKSYMTLLLGLKSCRETC